MKLTLLVPALFAVGLLAFALPGAVVAQDEEGDAVVHGAKLPPSDFYLARGTLVEIELLEPLDTATAKRNQVFHYRVVRDIKGEGGVVIRKGSQGRGWVLESRKGTKANPQGRLHLNFGEVPSVEGRGIQLGFTGPACKANETVGGLTAVIGGYFESAGQHARMDAKQRIVTAVEFPYGTRRIRAGEEGAQYRLFSPAPVQNEE